MKFKIGDPVRVTKDWAGEAKTGMVGTVRRIVDYGPDRIGVDFGENATTEMHTLEGTLMSDTGWYIPEDHLELIPREIKPGSKWRNVHREVTVHAATLESVMVGPVGETHASAFPIDFFLATHVWVSDPVETPKVVSWFKEPTSGDYYVVSEAKGNELFRTCCAEAKILHFHDLKPCEPPPLVKALEELCERLDQIPENEWPHPKARAVADEWRALKAKMGGES